jgi:hypothetical protein
MHMKCGLMSETSARLGPATLKMWAWHYTSKILGDRIIFVKVVPLYSCRPVIHIHAGHHYIPTWGLHARRECYWPSLNATLPPDLGAMSLNSKLLPPSPVVTVSPGAGRGMPSSAQKFSHRGRGDEVEEDNPPQRPLAIVHCLSIARCRQLERCPNVLDDGSSS